MDAEKVLKLAELARVRISPEEAGKLSHEFDAILNYVSEVKDASAEDGGRAPADYAVRNVLRKDSEGHDSGIYTEALLASAPAREGQFVKVKKIL